jgi:DNA helicase II / ATP-dependent DNA helicase PcrA
MAQQPEQLPLLPDLAPAPPTGAPKRLSVSGLVSYARCPRQCYWTVIEPLPRQGSPAARIGTLVHGWIERQASGQGLLLDHESLEAGEPDRMAGLKAGFVTSPYGSLRPLAVERPFAVAVGDVIVRGRVDAVYERDGRIEVVDFKTGRRPAADDSALGFQLDLYALAAVDAWGHDPAGLRTTEWYLDAGDGDSRDFDAEALDRVRARLSRALEGVAAGRFQPVPGSYCARCDVLGFCRTGRASLAAAGS